MSDDILYRVKGLLYPCRVNVIYFLMIGGQTKAFYTQYFVLPTLELKHADLQSEYPFSFPLYMLSGVCIDAAVGTADPGAGSGDTEI